ncbi:long cell-linked locus protein [Dorcoceras hygrometricum]|uniref:Long cell-linked locus protein n=1 Tax=Dorcoceras hygrometricum TaxID=472368 RepID=A0A2Z7D8G3_9LAMI|nr:long cell-linked locus protein [Dorcoceras hygrometricum]
MVQVRQLENEQKVKLEISCWVDACIEDERQYRAPHLPAGLLLAAMSRVIMVSQGVVELIQLVVPREMPPRHRGRARGHFPEEFEGQNEEVQRSIPLRRRARHVEDEVDELAACVDDMELVIASYLIDAA